MSHPQQLKFVEIVLKRINPTASWGGLNILEIGSHDVNGSIRNFFEGSDYCGVDLSPGDGVDVVMSGHELKFPNDTFDYSISCECFEHNPEWIKTFANMYRMTKISAYVIITCASTGRREHGTKRTNVESSPGTQDLDWDYYKNLTKKDFQRNFNIGSMFSKSLFLYNKITKDLYFVGIKRNPLLPDSDFNFEKISEDLFSYNTYVVPSKYLYNLLVSIYRFPRWLAEFLPDKSFQNFSIFYDKLVRRSSLEKKVKKLVDE